MFFTSVRWPASGGRFLCNTVIPYGRWRSVAVSCGELKANHLLKLFDFFSVSMNHACSFLCAPQYIELRWGSITLAVCRTVVDIDWPILVTVCWEMPEHGSRLYGCWVGSASWYWQSPRTYSSSVLDNGFSTHCARSATFLRRYSYAVGVYGTMCLSSVRPSVCHRCNVA